MPDTCPSCGTDEHQPPRPRVRHNRSSGILRSWQFTCPATCRTWLWCHGCGGWVRDRSHDTQVIRGRFYCDPTDHDYERCRSCERWLTEDEQCWGDNDYVYCATHVPSSSERGEGGDMPTERRVTCPTCEKVNIHMDLLTEQFICEHRAQELLVIKHPVLIHEQDVLVLD